MRVNKIFTRVFASAIVVTALLFTSNMAFAHCDGMDGPVVKAAQKALESSNVNVTFILHVERCSLP